MKTIRIGIIGLGGMGQAHARQILEGKIPGLELTAVADSFPDKLTGFAQLHCFARPEELLHSGKVDAVLIATPHFSHAALGIAALEAGLHVLVEKPVSVHKADALRLSAAADRRPGQIFAVMFNQRTDPFYQKIRSLLQGGEWGEVRRINWIITNWYRTAAYYASGSWRATWAGEGGGVLLNQCPHNLDLFQWIFGMPRRVQAHCAFGRYHDIEVEDDVSAYCEYANGAHATFITSTGEAPGTNRLEVTAEGGRMVYENDALTLTRNQIPMSEFSRTSPKGFAQPDATTEVITGLGHGGQHNEILANFAAAILGQAPLLAPGAEGIHSVELANAMLLSTWLRKTVELPLSAPAFSRQLQQRIRTSRYQPAQT